MLSDHMPRCTMDLALDTLATSDSDYTESSN